MAGLFQYFCEIKLDKMILWCYFIWYLIVIYFYFDPSLKIWTNSVGISAVIGTGLVLSVSSKGSAVKDHWQTLRLYLMPFCVSSFSALIKGKGFVIFISPKIRENIVAALFCTAFLIMVLGIKLLNRSKSQKQV
jgi:uncharacterized membrane protein YfcA